VKESEKFAIQVKRSIGPVGISAVQEVIGGIYYYDCDTAMVITNAFYTPSAIELAKKAKVELISKRH
jgi:restriction system protein